MENNRFQITRVQGVPVSDEELLDDLRNTANALAKTTVGQKEYRRVGKYDDSTVTRRFGSWNKALRAAGLGLSNEFRSADELFENILLLWSHYGRQPRRAQLALPPSKISQSPYLRSFGSWSKALERFVEFANAAGADVPESGVKVTSQVTPRDPSLRLRFRVLQKDRFTCRSCGKSPATSLGIELHVDHVIPWSKGGLTTIENLQTLCDRCNLGKGAG